DIRPQIAASAHDLVALMDVSSREFSKHRQSPVRVACAQIVRNAHLMSVPVLPHSLKGINDRSWVNTACPTHDRGNFILCNLINPIWDLDGPDLHLEAA